MGLQNLTIFSTLAVRAPFDNGVLAGYAASDELHFAWSPTTVIESKLAAGQHADVVIATDDALARLVSKGVVKAEHCYPLATALFGVAVRQGAGQPDISTAQSFLDTLCAARSVCYSLGGASGIYLQQVMAERGILTAVEPQATKISQGFTAEKLLSGEADVAVQQMSELMVVPGIDIVGPFPDELQQLTPFSVAVVNDCGDEVKAQLFIQYLLSEQCQRIYAANGLLCR